MSATPDHMPAPAELSAERLAALSPEDRRRIGTAMRLLVDVKKLQLAGMQIAADMMEGNAPADRIGMRLMDYERDLRIAATEMLTHPLKVVHADAMRTGQTKLDDSAWLLRTRIRASDARRIREEKAREDGLRAAAAPVPQDAPEIEEDAAPRPR